MSRNWNLYVISAMILAFSLTVRAQDSPSLGDLARQAQKDKSATPPKKVFTNDDLPPGSGFGSSGSTAGLATGLGQAAQPSASKQTASAGAADKLGEIESFLNRISGIDQATLVKTVLQGASPNFRGSEAWEEKLVSSRDAYVSQGRALLRQAREIEASVGSLKGIQDPNDPLVKNFASRLQQLAQDGVRADAAFQAVMMEGRDLAAQSTH